MLGPAVEWVEIAGEPAVAPEESEVAAGALAAVPAALAPADGDALAAVGTELLSGFRQTSGLFAPVGQRVFVLFEAGYDSASTWLHSSAQSLCIVCAGGANRSK